MGFKLYSDQYGDRPMIMCDVCGQPLMDFWTDFATATPVDGQTVDVICYHKTCVPAQQGSVTMLMIDFLRLHALKNSIGDIGSDGVRDRVSFLFPMGAGFEVISHDGGV